MVVTDRVNFLFADARSLYDDAIEMLDQGKIRNAAEKAWGATKRATDALVLVREGEEPQLAGQTRRAVLRLSAADPSFENLHGQYHIRAGLLNVNCFYDGNCEPEQEHGRPDTGHHPVHRPLPEAFRRVIMASGPSSSLQDLVRNVPITGDVGRASKPWYVPASTASRRYTSLPTGH